MLPSASLSGAVIEAIESALASVVAELRAERIEQEPDFTSQLVGELRGELRRGHIDGYRWDLKVLTDRGPGAQERDYGADLMVVQHIAIPGYRVSKGFLGQAKLEGKDLNRKTLTHQCSNMLRVTPESFLLIYGRDGVRVASASAVQASGANLGELRVKPLTDFLTELLTSWVGDERLTAADVDQLAELQREHRARAALGVFVEPIDL